MLQSLIPTLPPIDRSKAAVLVMGPEVIGDLLRLPAGQQVRVSRIDPMTGDMHFLVEGEGLPVCVEGVEPGRHWIICTHETRPGDGEGLGRQSRITAAWDFAPEAKWTLRDWSADQ